VPAVAPADRKGELLKLLVEHGILRRTAEQPVVSPDGKSARWMLDSLGISMSTAGSELAARCLLDALAGFEGRQLATYGTTGIPLMQACISHGGGRYHGLLIRKERKPYGSLKLIEGRIDPQEPVVIVDDSISSGLSVRAAVKALREHGLHVEGAVCLVSFGYEGVASLQAELDLKIVPLFDIWNDLTRHMHDEEPLPLNPTKDLPPLAPSSRKAAEGLHPCELARDAIEELLKTGRLLRAPKRVEGAPDGRGGVFVSLRRKGNLHDRPARMGHWNFPGEPRAPLAAELVRAAAATALELKKKHPRDAAKVLRDCSIAVTFFGPLERCTPGELDQTRYGIVVRSDARPWVMGGALPLMPGIANDWQQLQHARDNNARLYPLEPFTLYRHEVAKVVEPGAAWQPTGVPEDGPKWEEVEANVAPYLRAAWAAMRGEPVPPGLPPLPEEVEQLYLTAYAGGELQGCTGMSVAQGHVDLARLAQAARTDARFEHRRNDGRPAVSLSFLCRGSDIGEADPGWVLQPTRFGLDALEVSQGDRVALLLPQVAVTNDLGPKAWVEALIDKAGITRAPYFWKRWPCTTWLIGEQGITRMRDGLPERSRPLTLKDGIALLDGYLMQHHTERGTPLTTYFPFQNHLEEQLCAPWLAHGAWVKARAGRRREALDDLKRVKTKGLPELAFAALAAVELGRKPDPSPLRAAIDAHGRIGDEQEYAPGQVLYALALAGAKGSEASRALAYYRRRWRQRHAWGSAGWLMLAFAAWGEAETAFEIADWTLESQSVREGGWWNDHQHDAPGALAAVYLEGLAGGPLRLAKGARRRRYLAALDRGLKFLGRLVYQPCDAPVLPNPDWALGGVRPSLTAGEVRIDFVQHALSAMLFHREHL